MKWSKFIKQIEALGYLVTADTVCDRVVTRVKVVTRSGDWVATINGMVSYDCEIAPYSLYITKPFVSDEQHRLTVLVIQQMANTEIQNRGIVPAYVQRHDLEERHAAEV